jgi:hypothetical protein
MARMRAWSSLIVLIATAGCATNVQSPTPTVRLIETAAPSIVRPSPPSSPSPSPTRITPPRATGTPGLSSPSALDLEIHEVPREFAGFGTLKNLGNEIIWTSSGDMWRYAPGEMRPERIFAATQRHPVISIAGSPSGYVLLTRETIHGYDPPNRWQLWFLESPDAQPVLVDESDNEGLPSPTFAMNDRYIAWTSFHGTGDQAVSELRLADIDDLQHPKTLVSHPALDTSLWFPAFNGDEVWYGVSRNDWTAGTVHPRIEMLDLARSGEPPVIYGEDTRAFMPAVTDQVVVWKGGGEDDLAALNAGQPFVYWRDSGSVEAVQVPEGSWDRTSYPSVGDRFVAWSDEIDTHFYMYDLEAREIRVIAEYEPTGRERVLRPSVAGNLLAFIYSRGERFSSQIRWAYLPD